MSVAGSFLLSAPGRENALAVPRSRRDPFSPLLFATAQDDAAQDLVARFLREDAPALDWRLDFLRSETLERIFEELSTEFETEEEVEEVYYKSELVTTGGNAGLEDGS